MIELIGGLAAGCVVGYIAKDKLSPTSDSRAAGKAETEQLYAENEKLAKRNKELERETEDLLTELQKVRRSAKNDSGDLEDVEDKLDSALREIKALRQQNDTLVAKTKESKAACESLEAQLKAYKAK